MNARRVVLITGAGSGIGAATATRLAGERTDLVLSTRSNADGLARVAEAARQSGSRVVTRLGDLSDPRFAAELIDVARDSFSRVDQIVSNAGKAQRGSFRSLSRDDVQAAVSVNALPFFELVRATMDDLVASDWGRVVSLSSFVANDFGINGTIFPATSASKAAVEALTKSLAMELAPHGVCVNAVAPGYTRKVGGHAALDSKAWEEAAKATPNGKLAEPEDIAATIDFLLSRDARHITGQVLRVDGGLSLY